MKKNRYVVIICLLLMALFMMPAKADAKTVKLSQTKISMPAGASRRLTLTKQKKKVTWSIISGKKYVKLTDKKKTGVKITGLQAGTARIQAKIGNRKLTCKVTVKQKEAGKGYTMYLKAGKYVYTAAMVDNSSLSYTMRPIHGILQGSGKSKM